MNRVILADNQAIFRAGAARVLALEDDMRIAAQCEDGEKLFAAIEALRGSVVLVSSSLRLDLKELLTRARAAGSRVVMVSENAEQIPEDLAVLFDGVLCRNVPGTVLVDCVRRVAQGQRFVQRSNVTTMQAADSVGSRCSRPADAEGDADCGFDRSGLQEQRHRDGSWARRSRLSRTTFAASTTKTGVSDRLELALFTIHHRALAEAAARRPAI